MTLGEKIDALMASVNRLMGVINGRLRGKADKTEVYTQTYLDNPLNTLGANVASANKLKVARTIRLSSQATGEVRFDGSGDVILQVSIPALADKANKTDTLTPAEIDSRIQALVGAAPEALDQLHELANALGNDPNFAGTITTELAKKASKQSVADLEAQVGDAFTQLAASFNNGADQINAIGAQ
ncbi:hypothetical protein [Grimontia hollisae]|uniref:hypothetical protein n=1 Tax=Grimontia hollisae TaxID=673 RepID=UPI0013030F49|nr:hypothetical protein [Grimontia hollisae]